MLIVLLLLDENCPLDEELRENLAYYLRVFFRAEVRYEEVPPTPVTRAGWESLRERMGGKIKVRPGRPGDDAPHQLFWPQLVTCLEWMSKHSMDVHGANTDDADLVLGLTENEFYCEDAGLYPGQPAPEESTRKCFVRSRSLPIGVCSLTRLGNRAVGHGFRQFFRMLLKFINNSVLNLMGLQTCQSLKCSGYIRPVEVKDMSLLLCSRCEERLLGNRSAEVQERAFGGFPILANVRELPTLQARYDDAILRYAELHQFLSKTQRPAAGTSVVSHSKGVQAAKHMGLKVGFRHYHEFEEECDWLRQAEAILRECSLESCTHVGAASKLSIKKRSLLNGLKQAHERQPPPSVSQRTFSEPLLKRTCLVDMTATAPYRHGYGDLHAWTTANINRNHTTGGLFIELGGSMKPKTIATFVDAGLNATLLRYKSSGAGQGAEEVTQQARHRRKGVQQQRHEFLQAVEPPLRQKNARTMSYTLTKPAMRASAAF
jgi:hypothetical protein